MASTRQHLSHLSQILNNNDQCLTNQSMDEGELDDFFKSIASHRIRIAPNDWQGHRVDAMLWHLPDLRPAVQTAVSIYVVDRWGAYMDGTAGLTGEETTDKTSTPAAPVMNPQRPIADVENRAAGGSPRNRCFAAEYGPRRDWFDGLTDWVAAVLSLLKP